MIIIFSTKEIADEMLLEISVTPYDFVWLWYDPDLTYESGGETYQHPNEIKYSYAADDRCAISHPFSQDDLEWIQVYWDDGEGGYLNGVTFSESLPVDWGT